MNKDYLKLMLVTQRQSNDVDSYLEFIEQCLTGGVTCVQLREKHTPYDIVYPFAKQLKALCLHHHVPLIINDNVDLAVAIDADGVHLGQSDTKINAARLRLGTKKIIGLSLEAESQLENANSSAVNYVAASAVFSTVNKTNLQKLWGLTGLSWVVEQSEHPVIAIGGITLTNIREIMQAGASGAAVIGALHTAENPRQMAQLLREKID